MEFEKVPFTEVLSNIVDNRGKTCPTAETGLPLIATNCIRNENLYPSYDRVRYVDQDTYDNWFRGHPEPGDILFVCKGTPGRVCMTPDPVSFCIAQDMVAVRADETKIDPNYLFAFLRSRDAQVQIENMHVGTMIPHFKKGDFDKLMLQIPNRTSQEFIGGIYRTLSDKIELNRRMNETLESMARAIFKSWFVDFDPVRAKMDGQQPAGMNPETAALFPDSFEEQDGEMIPKGWRFARVADIGKVICGKTPSTKVTEYYGNDVPFITIPDMHGKIFPITTKKRLSFAGVESQRKKTLPVGAICVSCIATPGLTVMTLEESHTNQQINSVVPHDSTAKYFWFWTLHGLGEVIRAGGSGGSVLSNLSTGRFSELRVLSPPEHLRSEYHNAVRGQFGRLLANERECQTLANLRDTLLPKLLSGELRVPEAEKQVEEVV
jgi:type I restriction enzyme, S subunit